MKFYYILKSDLYKILHCALLIIHIIIPLIGVILFIWYYSFSPWSETDKISVYTQTLSISFPVLIGIITSFFAENEKNAGNFQMLLTTATPKYVPHLTKLLWILIFGLFSSLLALTGFGIGFSLLGYTTFNIIFYIETAILLFISVIPLYFIHYILSYFISSAYNIIIGITGTLTSALLLTGLGDKNWYYLPWGICARFSETLLFSNKINIPFLQFQLIAQSMLFVAIYTLIFALLFIILFSRWEGKPLQINE